MEDDKGTAADVDAEDIYVAWYGWVLETGLCAGAGIWPKVKLASLGINENWFSFSIDGKVPVFWYMS